MRTKTLLGEKHTGISDVKKPSTWINVALCVFLFKPPEFSLCIELRRDPKVYEFVVSLLIAGFLIQVRRKYD